MELPLYADLNASKLITSDGGTVNLSPLVLGDTPVFTLRTQERVDNAWRERHLNVRSLRASIGKVMEPPTSGFFRFRKPGTVTYPPQVTGSTEGYVEMRGLLITNTGGFLLELHAPVEGFDTLAESITYFQEAAGDSAEITFDEETHQVTVRCLLGNAEHLQADFEDLDGATASLIGAPFDGPGLVDGPKVSLECSTVTFSKQLAGYVGSFTVAEVQRPAPGMFLVRFNEPGEAPIEINAGELAPSSFARVRAFQIGSVWWHEVAFIQTPAAFTSSFDRVLPPAPSVERVRAGSSRIVGSSANTNEVQKLHIPSTFEGTYTMKWDYRATPLLGLGDGQDEIAFSLNGMYPDGKERFKVTNPEPEYAYIEFTGLLGETPQPLITTQVHSFAPGVITFALPLTRPEMYALLRDKTEVDLTFEVELEVVDDDQDAADPAIPGRRFTLFQQKIKIVREQIFDELADVPSIDWRKPPKPRSYILWTPDQIITGQQHYTAVFGDGVNRGFSFAYNLGTAAISSVVVRENAPLGRVYVHGEDYTLKGGADPLNELLLDIHLTKPIPASNSLAITITTAGPKSAFQDHTHTTGQIVGLDDLLDAVYERLTNIENKLPYTVPGTRTEQSSEDKLILIPDFYEVFPGKFLANTEFKVPKPPTRLGGLLPAIHDAVPEDLPIPMPAASGSAATYESISVTTAEVAAGVTVIPCEELAAGSITTGGKVRISGTLYTVETIALSGTQFTISPAAVDLIEAGAEVEKQILTPYAGNVFLNATGAPVLVPGGLGRRGSYLAPGEAVASDGRVWYIVRKAGATNSYYPVDFERELFVLPINDRMLRPGGEVSIEFSAAFQLLKANTRMQAILVIEIGEVPQQTTPAPVGVNLSDVTWNATPILAQRIILSGLTVQGTFGAAIRRSTDNQFTADRLLYDVWEASELEPASANFVLRARIIQWDTENSVANARGAVWVGMSDAKATISNA